MSEFNKAGWPDLLEAKFEVGDITETYEGEAARVVCVDRVCGDEDIAVVLALVTDSVTGIESSYSYSPNGTCSNGIFAYGDRGSFQYKSWNLKPLDKEVDETPEATPK